MSKCCPHPSTGHPNGTLVLVSVWKRGSSVPLDQGTESVMLLGWEKGWN